MENLLFSKIEELTPTYIKVLEDICNIESPTSCKAGVDAVGEYFINMAKERGWDIEMCLQPVSGNAVCITMNKDAPGEPICLSGHMDTVHPVGSFGTPAVRTEGDKIYAPGVVDCKGGIVVAFLAMDALRCTGFTARPVKLILQSDEENSSRTSNRETIKFMCQKAEGARAFFNLEGHDGKICIQRKGILTFEFTVNGIAGHASKCVTLGANAILEAAHKIIELEKFKDEKGLTCCCGTIIGGTTYNTIPAECKFRANVRYATQQEADYIMNFVTELAAKNTVKGCTATVSVLSSRIAMERTEKNIKLYNDMNAIFRENGLPEVGDSFRFGGSDAAYTTAAGIPTVDNMGLEGANIHTLNEFAYISSLGKMAKYLAAVTKNL